MLASGAIAQPDRGDDKRRAREGLRGEGATVVAAVDAKAPRPPEQLKKTQIIELKDNPAKKEIRALEDLIYTMEKPLATIWQWLDAPGQLQERDIKYVERQIAELDEKLAAVRAANPTWTRLAEYDTRVAHLKKAAAAQRGHADATLVAQAQANDAADAAASAAWAAKRVTDNGFANDLHKSIAGQILFATNELGDAESNASAFASSVNADDPLFVRAYLKESPWNALHTANVDCSAAPASLERWELRTFYTVNGGDEYQFGMMSIDKAAFQKKTQFAGSKHGSYTQGGAFAKRDDEDKATFRWIAAVAGHFKEGDNKVRLEMRAFCYGASASGVEIASGEITVKATAATLAALANRASFQMADSSHGKAELAPMREKLQRHYAATGWELIDLRTAGDWQVARNQLSGIILHREVPAVVVLRRKQSEHCELVSVMLEQPHDGSKFTSTLNMGMEMFRPFVCNFK